MAIYFDNSNITTGSRGPEGPQGIQGPIGPAGPNEITANTATSINGLLKGANGKVAQAEGGTDYATPNDAKAFVVTFTAGESGITADKTIQEILAAYETGRMILGIIFHHRLRTYILLQLSSVLKEESRKIILFTAFNTDNFGNIDMFEIGGSQKNGVDEFYVAGISLAVEPASATVLPASGTALTANTIYRITDAVGTYAFTPPESGWAHGMFTTDSSVSVSFSGTFMGAAPTIEASKVYEFDVFDGVWVVQEVVTA